MIDYLEKLDEAVEEHARLQKKLKEESEQDAIRLHKEEADNQKIKKSKFEEIYEFVKQFVDLEITGGGTTRVENYSNAILLKLKENERILLIAEWAESKYHLYKINQFASPPYVSTSKFDRLSFSFAVIDTISDHTDFYDFAKSYVKELGKIVKPKSMVVR